jgi:predicted carbohydrate-binding protein with CBM5 and CBM33 domain
MIVRRLAVLAGAVLAVGLFPAVPAFAHGAPISPISRSAACAAGGGLDTGAAACKAALKANGGAFGTFDDVRVPNVNGNDKKFVPDGQLCGGGLAAFKGLNIARDDFPATNVTSGKTLAIKYRATAAHQGSFRVYITNPGYDPLKKLTWADLGSKPITDVANPPLKDGSFLFSAKLPQRTGRQMLYIVWQTSNTPRPGKPLRRRPSPRNRPGPPPPPPGPPSRSPPLRPPPPSRPRRRA